MGKVKTLDYPKGLTFEKVWAALMEDRESLKKNAAETDRILKETARQMKEYDKRFGDFHNRFGEIVEYMVAPGIMDKFNEMGFFFDTVSRNKEVKGKNHESLFEVDILLENIDKALLVETKTKPAIKDVNNHIKRLEKMRAWTDSRGDKRRILGAIAGVVITANVRNYILEKGLFVVEPSGETFIISKPGKLQEW